LFNLQGTLLSFKPCLGTHLSRQLPLSLFRSCPALSARIFILPQSVFIVKLFFRLFSSAPSRRLSSAQLIYHLFRPLSTPFSKVSEKNL